MISSDALLDDLRRVYDIISKIPTMGEYDLNGITCSDTIVRRFGGWNKGIEICFGKAGRKSPVLRIKHNCECCGKITKNKKFCSRSCAVCINNKIPKRIKCKYYCDRCGKEKYGGTTKLCKLCSSLKIIEDMGEKTISDFRSTYARHKYQNVRNHAHKVAKFFKLSRVCMCGYDLHTELCHIKDISKFPKTAKLCEVNVKNNLVFLCCNHHWELDNGFLVL